MTSIHINPQRRRSGRLCLIGALICSSLLYLPERCTASDGMRKGPILSAGVGLTLHHNAISTGDISANEFGPSFEFKIGYAPTDRILIYLRSSGLIIFKDNGDHTMYSVPAWAASYYYAESAPSFFLSGGITRQWDRLPVLLGLGYEFKTGKKCRGDLYWGQISVLFHSDQFYPLLGILQGYESCAANGLPRGTILYEGGNK